MANTKLQIYEPNETIDETPGETGASIAAMGEQAAKAARDAPAWQRIVWWLSLAVMLPVGLGVLQMLALLIQAERVRGAFEGALSTAQLPQASLQDCYDSVVSRPLISQLVMPNPLNLRMRLDYPFDQPIRPSSSSSTRPLRLNGVVSADLNVPTSTLLPRWLGPRLPFVGLDEVHVHWEVTVGQEE